MEFTSHIHKQGSPIMRLDVLHEYGNSSDKILVCGKIAFIQIIVVILKYLERSYSSQHEKIGPGPRPTTVKQSLLLLL